MNPRKCLTCSYFLREHAHSVTGECRRFPQTIFRTEANWCGEWKENGQPKAHAEQRKGKG